MSAPVSRSSSSRQPLQAQPPSANLKHEVIEISTDTEDPPPRKVPRKNDAGSRSRSRAKTRPATPAPEVISLLDSDDEPVVPRRRKTPTGIQSERKDKRSGNDPSRFKDGIRQLALNAVKPPEEVLSEMQKLRIENESLKQSKRKLLGTLEEQITCEICTLKMWDPYTLMCGHTFCLGCLQDWFNTALVQHMTQHPNWPPNPPVLHQYRQLMAQNPQLGRRLEEQFERMVADTPQPKYTCPSCRAPVKSSPIEAFALKAIVRTVAEAEGETSPPRNQPRGSRRENPWSGFFPKLLLR